MLAHPSSLLDRPAGKYGLQLCSGPLIETSRGRTGQSSGANAPRPPSWGLTAGPAEADGSTHHNATGGAPAFVTFPAHVQPERPRSP